MTENLSPVDRATRNRNRWALVAIAALFFGALALAGLLRFLRLAARRHEEHGRTPATARGPAPGRAHAVRRQGLQVERCAAHVAHPRDDARLRRRPARRVRVAARTARQGLAALGQGRRRVHVLWVGPLPQGGPRPATLHNLRASDTLRAGLPRADDAKGFPVYVLDPNGFVVLRYAPGFDASGLRTDLSRLLKVN
jgi:hypothetical protein